MMRLAGRRQSPDSFCSNRWLRTSAQLTVETGIGAAFAVAASPVAARSPATDASASLPMWRAYSERTAVRTTV
jgi:hypothetical protein